MPKVAFYTLGCKVNQYESDAMAELFSKKGYDIVSFDSNADVYVINTCDVTNESARKSRQMIRKASRNNPHAEIVVVGCYSQLRPDEIVQIPGVDVIIGTRDRHKIVDFLEDSRKREQQIIAVKDIMKQDKFEDISFKGYRQRTRAFLKIQEGCNMFCSYCIIPYARGPIRSRPIESILQEAESLAADGFKEIVLTGIHLGLYGHDFKDRNLFLIDVIKYISRISGIERIRLSSIEAMELTDDFVSSLIGIKKFCEHLHIPLQSGNDRILGLMNRRYRTEQFREIINHIRLMIPDVSITTDVIVGFPGETEDDFTVTENFISELQFSRLHVFPFSPRNGTPAAKMKQQVRKAVKEERSRALINLGKQLEQKFNERFIGRTMDVLFEEKVSERIYHGYTGNYIKVAVFSDEDLHNRLIPVNLEENRKTHILGLAQKI